MSSKMKCISWKHCIYVYSGIATEYYAVYKILQSTPQNILHREEISDDHCANIWNKITWNAAIFWKNDIPEEGYLI